MLRTLLVPLDGSAVAEQALPHACRLARQTGAEIVLVRSAPFRHDPGRPSHPMRVTVRDAETYLQAVRLRLIAEGLVVHTMALHADPVRAITFTAQQRAADLIVMSTHGHSGLRHLLLDSVAEAVVQQTLTPVFLVRVSDEPQSPPAGPYRKVLVPLDGTPFAETALSYLLGMGCNPREIVLLCVASPDAYPPLEGLPAIAVPSEGAPVQPVLDREQTAAYRYLAQVGERYLQGRAIRFEVPVGGAGQAIAETAYGEGIEFIVMATHGRTGVDRLVHGSVAGEVLRHAPVPVLLLHGLATAPVRADQEEIRYADTPADVSLVMPG